MKPSKRTEGIFIILMFLFISHVEDPEQFQITTNLKTQRDPAIYRDFVVWEDKRNGNYDIYGYNFSANEEFQLTSDPRGQVLQRGHHLLWQIKSKT